MQVFEQIITKYPTVGRPISLVTQNIPDLLDKLERVAVAFCVGIYLFCYTFQNYSSDASFWQSIDIFKAAVCQDLEANPKVTREQLEAIPVPAFSRLLSRVVEVLIHHSILQASPQYHLLIAILTPYYNLHILFFWSKLYTIPSVVQEKPKKPRHFPTFWPWNIWSKFRILTT